MDDKKSIFEGLSITEKQAKLEEMRKIWAAETEQKKAEKKERERIIEELVAQKESLMEAYKNEKITLSKLTSELKKIESNPFYIKYMAEIKDENAKWGAAVEAANFYSEEQRAKEENADFVADAVVRRMYDSMSPEEQRRQDEIRKAKLEEENRLKAAKARETGYINDLRNSLRNLYLYVERGLINSKDDVRKLLTAEEVVNLGLHDVELLYTDEQIDSMTEEELKEICGKVREIRSNTKAEKAFDYPESEEQKLIRKEIEELYDLVMKVKYYVPGYLFSNEETYIRLESAMDAYDITDMDLIFKMSVIEDDLKEIAKEVANPTMTKDEKKLYYTLSGFVWSIALEKEKDPNYLYKDAAKVDSLLAEFERIKTKNPYIMEMMHILTKDIKKHKEQTEGKESAEAYQKKLDDLKIKSPLAGAPDPNTIEEKLDDVTKPDKKGIKSKRKAGEAEKAAASDSKKTAKKNGIKLLDYALPVAMYFAGGIFPIIGFVALSIRIIKDIRSGAWSNSYNNLKSSILNIGPSIGKSVSSMREKHDIRKDKRERRKAERELRRENIRAINRGISANPISDEDEELEEPEVEAAEAEHSRGGK